MKQFIKEQFPVLYDYAAILGEQLSREPVSLHGAYYINETGSRYQQLLAGMASTAVRRSLTRIFGFEYELLGPSYFWAFNCDLHHQDDRDSQLLALAELTWEEARDELSLFPRAHEWLLTFLQAFDRERGNEPFRCSVFRPKNCSSRAREELLTILAVHPYRVALARQFNGVLTYKHPWVVGATRFGDWNNSYRSFVSNESQMEELHL